ncbi:MAG: sulfatase [Solirubrobacteraceae bacterium]
MARASLGAMLAVALLAGGCGSSSPDSYRMVLLVPSVRAHRPHAAPAQGHAAGRRRSAATVRQPNIVFVLTDDLSMDLLKFMPHVRSLELDGMTFRNYFVSDSLCCPSRASILTGRFPHNTHVYGNTGAAGGGYRAFYNRGEELHTFAIALQRVGYLTALMGKYLNGYLPFGGRHEDGAAADVPATYVPPGWNEWDVAGWGYPEFNYILNADGTLQHFGHDPSDYLTDVLARRGTQFINLATQRHQPFFLELATFAPHKPYVPAPRNAHDFPGLLAPRPPNFDVLPSQAPLWLVTHPPLTSGQIHKINVTYRRRAQSVEAVDRLIGQIQQALRANGVARDTYVVFSSDNGLHTGQYRLMPGKLTAFNSDIHVPLVVTGPGVQPGSTTPLPAENIDLAKTFTDVGGTTIRGDGHSLLPLLHGHATGIWRNAMLVEHRAPRKQITDPDFQQPASGQPTTYEALRTREFLYVEYSDGELEFYDLRRDPFELNNIAGELPPLTLLQLHNDVNTLRHCKGGKQCWAATHIAPVAVP